ncbi:VWA domain-containing protein [bacterium]|nr:MAG: VWA domain-containing protein [bacterium]
MSFIAPLNFLFAGLLGAIVLLYILRLKRKERVVPSNMLWQSAIRDLQANAPWQKLRSSLLMWLQLAFVALAVLALVRPALRVLSRGGQSVAIILDASASMGATDVSSSRFDAAKNQATQLINALSSSDSATILWAGPQTRVLAPLSSDKGALKRALSNASNADTGCDLRGAITLAASLLKDKQKNSNTAQIYVISDGAVPAVQDLDVQDVGLQFVRVGSSSNNVAITALDARRGYAGGSAQVFTTVSNYSDQTRSVNLELARGEDLIEVRPISVPAAKKAADGSILPGSHAELFDDLRFNDGQFIARLSGDNFKDDLASDNVAYASLDAPRIVNVWLASDNVFLEKALNVDTNTRIFVGADSGGRDFDVVVCDGTVPKNLGGANQFIFNATTPLCPVEVVGTAPQPAVADYDRQSPVTRYAPWNDIKFAQSMAVTVKDWGQAVVEAERTPLVVAGEKGGQRVVWCGFDLRDTDLPLRVAFPIFVTNAVRWLSAPRGSNETADGAPLRTGEAVSLLAPPAVKQVSIALPDGSKLEETRDSTGDDGAITFDGAQKVGTYTASGGNWKQTFSVSLLNKSESDISPRANLQIADKKPIQAENRARTNRELWGYLVLFGLCILGIEWWVFHRGV